MDDLISRQAAIDALRTCYDTETITMDNGDEYINYGDAVGEIEQLPPAQPAELETLIKALEKEHQRLLEMQKALPEIVHCKDCKNWIPFDWMFSETWQSQNRDDYTQDEIGCSYGDMVMRADDFCSRAERIKGEAE